MRKRGFLIWLGVFVLLIGAAVWYGAANFIMCWDGMDVDEELLMENCGITREEFFEAEDIYETCPAAMDAVAEMTRICGCVANAAPATGPNPGRSASVPAGRPGQPVGALIISTERVTFSQRANLRQCSFSPSCQPWSDQKTMIVLSA